MSIDLSSIFTADRREALAVFLGLPAQQIRPLGPPGRLARFLIGDTSMAELQLELVPRHRGSCLAIATAAETVAGWSDEIPTLQNYTEVPHSIFGLPARVRPHLDWLPGAKVYQEETQLRSQIGQDIGRILLALENVYGAGFGTRPVGSSFVATRPTWRDEWWALIWRAYRMARTVGADLGPLSREAYEAVSSRLSALPAQSLQLVHGELAPSALWYNMVGGELRLVAVDDWHDALVGDAKMDRGYLITLPTPVLTDVLQGYGQERAREWLEPESILQLEAYHLGRCLLRLGEVAEHLLAGGHWNNARAVHHAMLLCRRALEPGFVEHAIEAALDGGPPAAQPTDLKPGLAAATTCLAAQPWQVDAMTMAFVLADALAGGQPNLTGPMLGADDQPINDHDQWWETQKRLVFDTVKQHREPSSSLVVLGLAYRAWEELDGTSDGFLRAVQASLSISSGQRIKQAKQRRTWAVLGLAALHWLGGDQTTEDVLTECFDAAVDLAEKEDDPRLKSLARLVADTPETSHLANLVAE